MKISLGIFDIGQFRQLMGELPAECLPQQICLHPRGLSRVGKLGPDDLQEISAALVQENHALKVSMVWDILMTENDFEKALGHFLKTESIFATPVSWRVQDPGAMNWMKENRPLSRLELLLLAGFNNSESIVKMVRYFASHVDKIILSPELPHEEIKYIAAKVRTLQTVEIEVLGLGPIPLFYSPRHLLKPHRAENGNTLKAVGTSDETVHRNFPLEDNDHGTFMWFPKDLFLFEHLDLLAASGVTWLRVEQYFDDAAMKPHFLAWTKKLIQLCHRFNQDGNEEWRELALAFKQEYSRPTIKGFFNQNRTDTLFSKLKNQETKRKDEGWVGDVMDLEKGHFIAFKIKSPQMKIALGEVLLMHSPEGKHKEINLHFIKNARNENVLTAGVGDLVMIPHVSGACVGSVLYKKS